MTLTHPTTGADSDYFETVTNTYDLRDLLITTQNVTESADEYNVPLPDVVNTSSNSYYADGKRSERVESIDGSEVTTQFYYVGDSIIYSTNESRVLQTENVLDLGGQIIASKRFTNPNLPTGESQPYANKYYLYSYDVRGSVTNIIGPDGNKVTGYAYDAFGNKAQTGDESFINDVTYTGSVSDDGSGLQYMNARFYQPETGRFLSQDTYTGVAADPRTQNLYSYCSNNPVNYIDPTGHAKKQIGTTGIWIDEGAYKDLQRQANQLGLNPEEIWKAGSASGLSSGQTKSIKEAAHKAERKQKARERAKAKGTTSTPSTNATPTVTPINRDTYTRRLDGTPEDETDCHGYAFGVESFKVGTYPLGNMPTSIDQNWENIQKTVGAHNVTRINESQALAQAPEGHVVIAYRLGVVDGSGADHYMVKQGQSWSELYGTGNNAPQKINTEDVLAKTWIDEDYYYDGGEFGGETLYFILKEDWHK